MTKQKIYPLNPIFETTTRNGQKAWVAFYVPCNKYPWRGTAEDMLIACAGWSESGAFRPFLSDEHDLTTLPEIPAEAREPKPGEVWEMWDEDPAIVTAKAGHKTWRYLSPSGKFVGELRSFRKPWPSDRPHGFETLIDAILQAHGEKT